MIDWVKRVHPWYPSDPIFTTNVALLGLCMFGEYYFPTYVVRLGPLFAAIEVPISVSFHQKTKSY